MLLDETTQLWSGLTDYIDAPVFPASPDEDDTNLSNCEVREVNSHGEMIHRINELQL